MRGRLHVTIEDIEAAAFPVLRHRIVPNFNAAAEGISVDQIILKVLSLVPREKGRSCCDVPMTQMAIQWIGEYPVVEELAPGDTYVADGPGGRRVVLKRLAEDLPADGRLHVSIRERLERIREVAHPGVANLYGVERAGNFVFMVWEYIDGTRLDEYLMSRETDLTEIGRDLIMSVQGLGNVGLVHGALHGGNIFMTADGIRLTHLSPFLYDDPAADAQAVVEMLLGSLNKRYLPGDLPVHALLSRAAEQRYSLARLGPLLACPPDSPLNPRRMGDGAPSLNRGKRNALLMGLAAILTGFGTTAAILYYLGIWPKSEWLDKIRVLLR